MTDWVVLWSIYLTTQSVDRSEARNSYTDDGTGREVGRGRWPQATEVSTSDFERDCKPDD